MYFAGIDISQFKHDCAVIDEIGDTIQPSWPFGNDREGFSLLKERLDSLPGDKKTGLEATGHYGQNLKLFLEANGFAFMEFNPLLVSRFVHGKSLRNTKTDSIGEGLLKCTPIPSCQKSAPRTIRCPNRNAKKIGNVSLWNAPFALSKGFVSFPNAIAIEESASL